MSFNVKINVDGKEFWASARQAAAIQMLIETRKGGFAQIKGYVSTSGRVSPETADFTVLTRFDLHRLYARKIKAITDVTLNDISDWVEREPKLKAAKDAGTLEAEFEKRKTSEIASMEKTLLGERDDSHRAAHDRCYHSIDAGVKVHFKTETGEDGLKHPALKDGLPVVESIMLSFIEISRNILVEGEYKKVNSGVPVLISNAISSKLPKSCTLKMASLKEDNFTSIIIDNNIIVPKDIQGDFT